MITRALSVRAPWWWFIVHGFKPVENRDWPTSFRGTVYIHASQWVRRRMTAQGEAARAAVLAVWPEAYAATCEAWDRWHVYPSRECAQSLLALACGEPTEEAAWIVAAANLAKGWLM